MSVEPFQIDASSLLETFYEEADEHLASFEQGLLELEAVPDDREVIARVFRAAHSIKGGSGIVGLNDVAHFTHALESVLDRLRNGSIVYESRLAGLLLRSLDMLKSLLVAARRGSAPPEEPSVLYAQLQELTEEGADNENADQGPAKAAPASRSVAIEFTPHPEFMGNGLDPVPFVRDVASMGDEVSVELELSSLPELTELEPESCYLRWRVHMRTAELDAALREIFSFAEGLCDLKIAETPAGDSASEDDTARQPTDVARSAPSAPARGAAAEPPPAGTHPGSTQTIRVATDKLDQLVDLVGELVIAQAMIVDAFQARSEGDRVSEALAVMDRNMRDLQEAVMAIRMVPLATVFGRLPRVVRDLAVACGKKVRIEIDGEGTEIDKGMVEQLVDPLIHLVRNAIDHGIEPPAARLTAGKSEEGVVSVRALHEGGSVVISVGDDGRGLPTEAIRSKALMLGLMDERSTLLDQQLHELVFHPGFSTADAVTAVSGRGVGMDVVKRNVEALNGSLSIASEPGRGTKTRLRLPLTLAILDGLSIRVGAQIFILPLFSVVESFRPTASQVRGLFGRRDVIDLRGSSLPIVRLHEIFRVEGAVHDPCTALVCVVETNGTRIALLVDDVVGQPQVVVKSLEANYRKVDSIMGATILGDGRVAMILDIQSLARTAIAPASGASKLSSLDHLGPSSTPAPEVSWNP